MTSERVFVGVLRLLNVDFREYLQKARKESKNSLMPDSDYSRLFNNLPELQTLNEVSRLLNSEKIGKIRKNSEKFGKLVRKIRKNSEKIRKVEQNSESSSGKFGGLSKIRKVRGGET